MFTRLSRENAASGQLFVPSVFINEYLPYAPESFVKIYLFGLAAAQGLNDANTLARLSLLLGEDEESVLAAFSYWEENGLVCVHRAEETFIEYLPVLPIAKQLRKYSKEKYKGFNDQLSALLPSRNFLPNEYNEYYYCMESLHIEVEAMLIIIGYCKRLKGENVHTAYVLTVARNFASEGCTTYERVKEKIDEYDFLYKDVAAVLKALKLKRRHESEDSVRLSKWTKTYGFDMSLVMSIAQNVKRGGMDTLDNLLTKYYEKRLTSKEAIEAYELARKKQYELMSVITRRLGLNYERLDSVIETYLVKWQGLGYTDETLALLADYCLKMNMRTLQGMDSFISNFAHKGLLSQSDIEQFMNIGESVGKILSEIGIICTLDLNERTLFHKWKVQWETSDELIALAASSALGKDRPLSYMDRMIGNWFDAGVKDRAGAENFRPAAAVVSKAAEELNALMESLDTAADLKRRLMDEDERFYENEKAIAAAEITIARGGKVDKEPLLSKRRALLKEHGLEESDVFPS